MTPDERLVLILGVLHLVALLGGIGLFAMLLRGGSEKPQRPSDDDEPGGGGGNDRIGDRPKISPSGGIPLPDAEPAPIRLRSAHERLADAHPRPDRRRTPEPEPRRPVPSR
jgi:hypothetical protein